MTSADLIVTNARVLTMNEATPQAVAVAVASDRILAVRSAGKIMALRGAGTELVDAKGATLLPGFFEIHCHVFLGKAELGHLQLAGVMGFDNTARAIRAYAEGRPGKGMLVAQGADYAIFGRPTTRHEIDRIVPDRPLALVAGDHHTVWANTVALQAAGLLRGRETPVGSEVVMEQDGLASGELRERPAFDPVLAMVGLVRASLGLANGDEPETPPTPEQRAADRAMLFAGLSYLASYGITSAVNMDGNLYTLELLQEGRLPVQVETAFHFKPWMDLPLKPTVSQIPRHRWPDADRWTSLDAPLAFASDWPVSDVAVLRGIRAAVCRRPWTEDLPDEGIGLMGTLAAYTCNGAWASHTEERTGRLRRGLLADMVLLSGDIEALPPEEIDRLTDMLTVCGGRVTHQAARA